MPVHFVDQDKSPGLRRGGILNIVRHDIELSCNADAIPDSLTVSLDGLEIGDSIHISAVTLPPGTRPTITGRDFTIASVAAPTAVREEQQRCGRRSGRRGRRCRGRDHARRCPPSPVRRWPHPVLHRQRPAPPLALRGGAGALRAPRRGQRRRARRHPARGG